MSSLQVRLRKARNAARLTQENVALELGVSKSQVSAWETGKEKPSTKHLPNIRRVLNVSLDTLFAVTNENAVKETRAVYNVEPKHAAADLASDIESMPADDMVMLQSLVKRLRGR